MKNLFLGIMSLASGLSFAQNRNVGDFQDLKVYDRISVELVESNKSGVDIIGDDNGIIEVVNKNGELKVRTKTTKLLQGDAISVRVYYNNLHSIQASQGARISSDDTVEAKSLKITSNEGSKINLKTDVDYLEAKGNSGGEIELYGKADRQDILMNSGAVFRGKELESNDAKITVNAGGKAEVYASESVDVTVRAGGSIDVYGNPEQRNTKKVIGGKINFK